MPPKKGATQYHSQLGFLNEDRTIKELTVCNNWDLEPLDLLNVWSLVVINRPLRYYRLPDLSWIFKKTECRICTCQYQEAVLKK